tara:strand:+ start:1045 stop:2052 length:1008 start_codon:yes stop_codon:yes gene_type:complete
MKILVVSKLYLHKNHAGGEAYLHHFLKMLQKKSNKIKINVLLPNNKEMKKYNYEDIIVNETTDNLDNTLEYCKEADLVITHLDVAYDTIKYCLKNNIPNMFILHNSLDLYNPFIEDERCMKIFNSHYVKNDYLNRGLVPNNYHILYPYTDFPKFSKFRDNKKERKYITLINPSENKGADVVLRLAKKKTKEKFLIVKGGYYPHHQEYFINEFQNLPNCHVIDNTKNIIREIYLKSKIILQPTNYETYGMVSAEASCFGIPCIVNQNSPGLVENLGKVCLSGIDKNVTSYEKVIDSLSIPQNYHIWSNYYYEQAEERYNEVLYQFDDFYKKYINLD